MEACKSAPHLLILPLYNESFIHIRFLLKLAWPKLLAKHQPRPRTSPTLFCSLDNSRLQWTLFSYDAYHARGLCLRSTQKAGFQIRSNASHFDLCLRSLKKAGFRISDNPRSILLCFRTAQGAGLRNHSNAHSVILAINRYKHWTQGIINNKGKNRVQGYWFNHYYCYQVTANMLHWYRLNK